MRNFKGDRLARRATAPKGTRGSMKGQPVQNMYRPIFMALCSSCGLLKRSPSLVCDEEPWTYVCWYCVDSETRDRMGQEDNRQFALLQDYEKDRIRTALDGASEAGRIRVRGERR